MCTGELARAVTELMKGAATGNAEFVNTVYTAQDDFIFVWFLENRKILNDENRLFPKETSKFNQMREYMCDDFADSIRSCLHRQQTHVHRDEKRRFACTNTGL
jgi:hypothetical protein